MSAVHHMTVLSLRHRLCFRGLTSLTAALCDGHLASTGSRHIANALISTKVVQVTSLVLPTASFHHTQEVWRLHVISLVPPPYCHYPQAYTCLWIDIPASGDCPGFTLVLKMSRWTSHSPSTFFHRRTCLETRKQLMYSKSGQQLQIHETRMEFKMVLTSQAQISCHHWSRWRSGSSWRPCPLHPRDQSHHSAEFGMSHPSGLVVLVALSNLNKWIMTISNDILQFNQDMGWRPRNESYTCSVSF